MNRASLDARSGVVCGVSQAAPFSDYPFKRNVFWCHVFPPYVYKELDQYWPPISIMHKDVMSGKSRQVSHKHADERYKTSLEQLVKLEPSKARRCAPKATKQKKCTARHVCTQHYLGRGGRHLHTTYVADLESTHRIALPNNNSRVASYRRMVCSQAPGSTERKRNILAGAL